MRVIRANRSVEEIPRAVPSLLQARHLVVEYGRRSRAAALKGIEFHVDEGTVIGVAGASGSGKSTLARCLAGWQRPTAGEVLYRGIDVSGLTGKARLDYCRSVQLVPQDAAGSLNPRFTAVG